LSSCVKFGTVMASAVEILKHAQFGTCTIKQHRNEISCDRPN
jgi:hypothetical protein